jgi:O-antigen ligase
VVIDGVRRATSVYGHPNNLGLYLGRVWPLAAALAAAPLLARASNKEQQTAGGAYQRPSWFFALCALLCLGGIVVSFSRGAWLGAVAALAVLTPGLMKEGGWRTNGGFRPSSLLLRLSSARWLIAPAIALVVVGGLALSLRGDLAGDSTSTRALIWREAIGYLRQHPLGLGLDQFLYYHDPRYGRSLIDPSLLNSSEVYAAHPHNFVLDAWLRVGPLGLIAFGWLLARLLRAALPGARARPYAPLMLGALAAIAAALVHGLVDNFYFVPDLAFAFWLLLALVETERDKMTR